MQRKHKIFCDSKATFHDIENIVISKFSERPKWRKTLSDLSVISDGLIIFVRSASSCIKFSAPNLKIAYETIPKLAPFFLAEKALDKVCRVDQSGHFGQLHPRQLLGSSLVEDNIEGIVSPKYHELVLSTRNIQGNGDCSCADYVVDVVGEL